ncbi:MAG TPA: AMP-binding protein, partial [Mycobacterium sp.]
MSNTKLIGGRRVRWDDERAAEAYARGWWVRDTLADSLADAAQRTPQRTVLIDGDCRVDCERLSEQATALARALLARMPTALARALLARMPTGSVVSFMLPNWHEATVIYLAATIAGMVVNPILPSLRDRELLFILNDADTRMIFVPSVFGRHDYASMLTRAVAQMESPPEVVVVRADVDGLSASHTSFPSLLHSHQPAVGLPTLDPDAVRMILYTSGTTGRPKGVLHSHNSMHALIRQLREHWQVQPGDRFLVPSPIAHIGGSIYAFECPLL